MAQAIPSYCMQVFLLPSTLVEELQKLMNKYLWKGGVNETGGLHWFSWNRLTVRKENSGMGFRHMPSFNLALLGKQCWRVALNHNCVLSSILKAKYFPNCDFWQARDTRSSSFTWQSMLKARTMLRKGIRWKIGDGESIRVWGQPWIRRDINRVVQNLPPSGMEDIRVRDLWIPLHKEWDIELLSEYFDAQDVLDIINTRLSPSNENDCIIWHFTRDGCYSVKSGYRVAFEDNLISPPGLCSNGWRKIWKLSLPLKIQNFIWHLCVGCLPTRSRLRQRGLNIPGTCLLCDQHDEDDLHLFLLCPFTINCLALENLSVIVTGQQRLDLVLLSIIDHWPVSEVQKLGTILWGVWKQRNNVLWNDKRLDESVVVNIGKEKVSAWQAARVKQISPVSSSASATIRWTTPAVGWVKCNVDAGFRSGCSCTFAGAVLRDSNGHFISCCSWSFYGVFLPHEAEIMGLKEALSWIERLGYGRVIFEVDALSVVRAVESKQREFSEFDDFVQACILLFSRHEFWSPKHVPRNANFVAHSLVKSAFLFSDFMFWSHVPSFLLEAILTDRHYLA